MLLWENKKYQISSVADPFHFDMDPNPDPALNPTLNQENTNFYFTFFCTKYISPKTCSVLIFMVKIFMSVKHKFNIFEKIYDVLMILVDFCGNSPWFWLIFCFPDPDPFHENGSGSGWPNGNGSGSATLHISKLNFVIEMYWAPILDQSTGKYSGLR